MWNFRLGGLWGNIFACGAVTKFVIFKFLAIGVKPHRLKPVRNDFKSVYHFIERREGKFYMLEPWNKREYAWPPRFRTIDAFDVFRNFRCNFAPAQVCPTPSFQTLSLT